MVLAITFSSCSDTWNGASPSGLRYPRCRPSSRTTAGRTTGPLRRLPRLHPWPWPWPWPWPCLATCCCCCRRCCCRRDRHRSSCPCPYRCCCGGYRPGSGTRGARRETTAAGLRADILRFRLLLLLLFFFFILLHLDGVLSRHGRAVARVASGAATRSSASRPPFAATESRGSAHHVED